MTTVILAHGEFPSSARTLGFLKQADRIIKGLHNFARELLSITL